METSGWKLPDLDFHVIARPFGARCGHQAIAGLVAGLCGRAQSADVGETQRIGFGDVVVTLAEVGQARKGACLKRPAISEPALDPPAQEVKAGSEDIAGASGVLESPAIRRRDR